jgi:hypothetical protein
MRNNNLLKKSVYAVATTAFVAALGIGFNSNAATVADSANVSVNTYSKTLTIRSDRTDTNLMVGFGALKSEALTVADKDMDVYTVSDGSVSVDLSHLNTTKDNYVLVKGDANSDPMAIKIKAADAKLKAKVTYPNNDDVSIALENTNKNSTFTPAKDNSNVDISLPEELGYSDLLQRGATLYVTTKPTEFGTLKKAAAGLPSDKNDKDNKNIALYDKVTVTAADESTKDEDICFASKEIKVKVAKRANAPKAKVDYAKNEVTIPNKAVYKVSELQDGKFTAGGDWSAALTAANIVSEDGIAPKNSTPNAAVKIGDKDKIFYIRTPQKDDKKPASKTGFVRVNAIAATLTNVAPTEVTTGGSIVGAKVNTISGSSTVVEVTADDNLKAGKKGKIIFTNKDDNAYDVIVVGKDDLSKLSSQKVNKLAAGSNKTKAISVDPDKDKGKYVYIRQAGNSKKSQFASAYVYVGTICGTEVPSGSSGGQTGDTFTAVSFEGLTDGALELHTVNGATNADITAKANVDDSDATYSWSVVNPKNDDGQDVEENALVTFSAKNTKTVKITKVAKGSATIKASVTIGGVTKEATFSLSIVQ